MDLAALVALSLALGLAAWLFFLWSVKSGQYDDPEGAKYRMLEEDAEPRESSQPGDGSGSTGARRQPATRSTRHADRSRAGRGR